LVKIEISSRSTLPFLGRFIVTLGRHPLKNSDFSIQLLRFQEDDEMARNRGKSKGTVRRTTKNTPDGEDIISNILSSVGRLHWPNQIGLGWFSYCIYCMKLRGHRQRRLLDEDLQVERQRNFPEGPKGAEYMV
jgi:hypothetical protein